jgi:hypothetical protein
MKILRSVWVLAPVVAALLNLPGSIFASPITVDSVGVLDPNPNSLTLADAVSNSATNGVTLSSFQTLITNAYANNTGGVLDFQEQYQGGTWPNNPQNSPNNGVTVGNGSANTITATYGVSQTPTMSFFRNNSGGAGDGIDAAVNQGTNVISGGYTTRNGGGSGSIGFSGTTPVPVSSGGTTGIGGGYMGIAGNAATELDFNNGLAAFGITALPRGASRHTQITLTLSDNSTIVGSNDLVTTSAVFWGFQLTPAQLSSGLTITKVAFAHPDGVNRYDDLAFVVAVPEPASLLLMGLSGVSLLALRRLSGSRNSYSHSFKVRA